MIYQKLPYSSITLLTVSITPSQSGAKNKFVSFSDFIADLCYKIVATTTKTFKRRKKGLTQSDLKQVEN